MPYHTIVAAKPEPGAYIYEPIGFLGDRSQEEGFMNGLVYVLILSLEIRRGG